MERPKRRITSRCLEYNHGMLPEEEVALRRALHASLGKPKTPDVADMKEKLRNSVKHEQQNNKDNDNEEEASRTTRSKSVSKTVRKSKKDNNNNNKRKSEGDETKPVKRQKKLVVQMMPKGQRKESKKVAVSRKPKQTTNVSKDKKKQNEEKEKKVIRRKRNMSPIVHAQRKFAQTNPVSPRSALLYHNQKQPSKTRAKTEDFLDFLCLRGTERMPKSLELFNNPCAPVSPLTDDEEPTKSSVSSPTASKLSCTDSPNMHGSHITDTSAKRSLVMGGTADDARSSNSSPTTYTITSPISTRVQPHAVLPQFTNAKTNYGVLTHIPTPIPYPPIGGSPPKLQGVDVYGVPYSSSTVPPGLSCHPSVTSVAMGTHQPPQCPLNSQQGFYLVNSNPPGPSSSGMVSSDSAKLKYGSKTLAQIKAELLKLPKAKGKVQNSKTVNNTPSKCSQKDEHSSSKVSATKSPKAAKKRAGQLQQPAESFPAGVQGMDGVPLFMPTEQEFKQPFQYIESVREKAEQFGICVIVPPATWKPDFCLSDEIRFTTKLQHIHRLGRSHPTAVEIELTAIKRHLELQDISLSVMPHIAGCELDLPHLSSVVREFGGLQQVIDKRKWGKVADTLKIPKSALERTGKLEQIYCKYLLSYDLLTEEERNQLFQTVQDSLSTPDSAERKYVQECMSKGRSVSLSLFQRTAKNNIEHHMKAINANVKDVEKTYWELVEEGKRYTVVHTAEMCNTGFPTGKGLSFSKSKWNLNVLPKVVGSAVRDVDEVEGISSPLIKVDMIFSTDTWKTTPRALYTLEYLHEGADKILYSIPKNGMTAFTEVTLATRNSETGDFKESMVSPSSLINSGVPVYKVIQQPGQFVVKFPNACHSSISAGYSVSEFVSVAPWSDIQRIKESFQDHDVSSNCFTRSVDMFSWEYLIVASVISELKRTTNASTMSVLLPELEEIRSREAKLRSKLSKCGIVKKPTEKSEKDEGNENFDSEEVMNCHECDHFCFLSAVNDQAEKYLCLEHALRKSKENNDQSDKMRLVSRFNLAELEELVKEAEERLNTLQRKPKSTRRRAETPGTSRE